MGKKEMAKYLGELLGPVPFYNDFRRRKALEKQPDAIKLPKRIRLAPRN